MRQWQKVSSIHNLDLEIDIRLKNPITTVWSDCVLTLQGSFTKGISAITACLLPQGGGLTDATGFFAVEDDVWFWPFLEPLTFRAVSFFRGALFFTVVLESACKIIKILL